MAVIFTDVRMSDEY